MGRSVDKTMYLFIYLFIYFDWSEKSQFCTLVSVDKLVEERKNCTRKNNDTLIT